MKTHMALLGGLYRIKLSFSLGKKEKGILGNALHLAHQLTLLVSNPYV
jgi:hypothetical protein